MYETFIGLNKRPFAAVPTVEGYFPGTVSENAREMLARCIERGEGIGMLVGPVGTGKTLLCQKLAEQFNNAFHVVLLTCGRISSRRSLFQTILYELDQPYRSMDEGEMRLALVDYLERGEDQKRGLLLLVDEAHTLPLRLLDELRMLTNLARGGQPLVRVILSGSCALEERLANPKLDSFNSRIATRCYLEAFNRSETADYLRAKIDLTGGNGEEVFSDEACQSVYQATEGVPRLINQLCDHALLVAFSTGRRRLEAAQIEEAWADLQQLPTPWNSDSQGDKPGVIEFGCLDDSFEEDSAESIKMPTPPLKLNAEADDFEFELNESFEPADQIDSIKQMINGAEENFAQKHSDEPEIELAFDDFDHPFEEPFEHEEIVGDRYAAPTPAVSVLQSVVPVFQFETLESPLAIDGNDNKVHIPQIEESVNVQEEPREFAFQEVALSEDRDDLEQYRKTVVLSRTAEAPKTESVKKRITIAEKDHPAEEIKPPQSVKPIRPVRQNDYSRLFVKLRQG
jgi:type II secretory pathway predicted ATPase ExeA